MPKNINLVPEEVKKEQAKEKLVKKSTVYSIILLVLVGLGTGYLVYRQMALKNNIQDTNAQIESLRSDIRGMQDIEVKARKLDKQYKTIQQMLNQRKRYSLLLQELDVRLPSNVDIETFTTGNNNTVNISGRGADYLAVAEFVNNLSNSEYEGATPGMENLFMDVSLNSVNLDTQSNQARYFIVVTVNSEILQQGVN